MGLTYENSGVDIKAEDRSIQGILSALEFTFKNRKGKVGEVIESKEHFANYVKIGNKLFVLCTDSVGTKVLVAQQLNKYDTIGIDMIAMNVNDMICVGAEPIALVDFLAMENVNQQITNELTIGMVKGADQSGIAIIGGETATLKGVITGIDGKGFELAGTCMGIVDEDKVITGQDAKPGHHIIGLESSGIHSNGLTLARKAIDDDKENLLELLKPTKIYVKPVLEMINECRKNIHAIYHITGSGFLKFKRLKKNIGFNITNLLPVPDIFNTIQTKGNISDSEMFRTFNMGVGLAIVTDNPDPLINIADKYGIKAQIIGTVDDSCQINIAEKSIVFDMND